MRTTIRAGATAAAASIAVIAVAGAAPSSAKQVTTKPTTTETKTETYVLPAYDYDDDVLGTVHVSSGDFAVPSWARYVSVAVTDATGLPTAGAINLAGSQTGQTTTLAAFCGRTTQSYAITPSEIRTLWVDLRQGPCDDGTVAGGSTGTIDVTFTS